MIAVEYCWVGLLTWKQQKPFVVDGIGVLKLDPFHGAFSTAYSWCDCTTKSTTNAYCDLSDFVFRSDFTTREFHKGGILGIFSPHFVLLQAD